VGWGLDGSGEGEGRGGGKGGCGGGEGWRGDAWGGGGLVREGREREERGRMTASTSGYVTR